MAKNDGNKAQTEKAMEMSKKERIDEQAKFLPAAVLVWNDIMKSNENKLNREHIRAFFREIEKYEFEGKNPYSLKPFGEHCRKSIKTRQAATDNKFQGF